MPRNRDVRVAVLTKEQVIQMINNWSTDVQTNIESEVSKTLPERKLDFVDRNQKKAMLGKMGVAAETKEDYRLAIYHDGAQLALLVGKMDEGGQGITLTRSIAAANANDKDVQNRLIEAVGDLGREDQGGKNLIRPIVLPVVKSRTVDSYELLGIPGCQLIELSPEKQGKLEAEVTLLTLSNNRINRDTLCDNENAKLPTRQKCKPVLGV